MSKVVGDSTSCKVDIRYNAEVEPKYLSLIDIALSQKFEIQEAGTSER